MPGTIKNVSVLMVCLGICRSPMAEAVLNHQIAQRPSLKERFNFTVDSAGTGAYHEGDEADERTIETCKKHAVPISCRARPIRSSDYDKFDYILAMDNSNLQTLLYKKPATSKAHISLFGAYDPALHLPAPAQSNGHGHHSHAHHHTRARPKAQPIVDPYYDGVSGFEQAYWQCAKYASGFLDYLEGGEQAHSVGGEQTEEASKKVLEAMGA